jgi:hypothetical protein
MCSQASALSSYWWQITSDPEITIYAFGECLDRDTLSDSLKKWILTRVQNKTPNLVPTTYEASKAYIDQVLPNSQDHDLTREMCMILVLKVPKDHEICLVDNMNGIMWLLSEGEILIYNLRGSKCTQLNMNNAVGDMIFRPTYETPPSLFGTREKPYSNALLDKTTSTTGAAATLLLSYFTRVGNELEFRSKRDTLPLE